MGKKPNLCQYEEPKITTYTSEDILEVMGPVQAITNGLNLQGGGLGEDQVEQENQTITAQETVKIWRGNEGFGIF